MSSVRPSPIRARTFAVLLVAAVTVGLAEVVAATAIGLGCAPGMKVACFGPQNGLPAAPGYWFGTTLEGVGFVLVAMVALVGLIGVFGVRLVRRRWLVVGAVVLLFAAAGVTVWAAAILGGTPSAAFCRGAGDGCHLS